MGYQERSVDLLHTESYSETLNKIVEIADNSEVNIVIVGGTIADIISDKTKVTKIDPIKREIYITDYNEPAIVRKDGTVKDLNTILFCSDKEKIDKFRKSLKVWSDTCKEDYVLAPHISIEPTKYFEKRKPGQMVSSIDYDEEGYSFNFGPVREHINESVLQVCYLVLEDGTKLPTFDPFLLALRYCMRNASGLKRKDFEDKLPKLLNLADQVASDPSFSYGKYAECAEFMNKLVSSKNLSVRARGLITRGFWNTIGTSASHGSGLFKYIQGLSDKFGR